MSQSGATARNRAAIILAGGEGVRLRALTTKVMGRPTPKQFCPLINDISLLEETEHRVALAVPKERTLTVLSREHEVYYEAQTVGVPESLLIVQPQARGTAVAIFYALFRAIAFGSDAAVAIFPSDHYVDQDAAFMNHVQIAFKATEVRPELTVLLGVVPECPELNYGWIEPADRVEIEGIRLFGIRTFVEKPPQVLLEKLRLRGALCNTLVMVARISTLLGLLLTAQPALYESFAPVRTLIGSALERSRIEDLYRKLEMVDFSSHVLAAVPANLSVLPVHGATWSDLGEPRRVMETIGRLGRAPRWAAGIEIEQFLIDGKL